MALTSYIAHCQADDKGDTIELVTGSAQEIVDCIAQRRKSYGSVKVINFDYDETGQLYHCLMEYRIKTTT